MKNIKLAMTGDILRHGEFLGRTGILPVIRAPRQETSADRSQAVKREEKPVDLAMESVIIIL
jgi:hypothetical protein